MAVAYPIVALVAPPEFSHIGGTYTRLGIFLSSVIGLVSGILIGIITEYYTGDDRKPVIEIARQSQTGPATNIIAGIGTGMLATGIPVVMLVVAIFVAHEFAGLYGIGIAALGMLATTGIQLAVDAYGPIADNAGGIAEMAAMPPFTALSLFVAFKEKVGIEVIDITKADVVVGMLFGGMLPYVFSSFVIGGNIDGSDLASSVLPLPGGPIIMVL